MELNTIPKTGDYGTGVDRHNDNYQKIGLKLETLENMSLNEKGYFETLTALEAKYPTPQSGWQAYVKDAGSSTGYYVANVNSSGDWVVTSAEAPAVAANLNDYTLNGGSTKTTQEIEDEIVQLAGSIELNTDLLETGVKDKVIDLDKNFGDVIDMTPLDSNYTGSHIEAPTLIIKDVEEGDSFLIQSKGQIRARLYGFVDSGNVLLKVARASTTEAVDEPIIITAPKNAAKVILHIQHNVEKNKAFSVDNKEFEYLSNEIDDKVNINELFDVKQENLFDGTYFPYTIILVSGKYEVSANSQTKSAYIPIEGGETYHIHKQDSSNRFRVGVSNIDSDSIIPIPNENFTILHDDKDAKYFTFKAPLTAKMLIVNTVTDTDPIDLTPGLFVSKGLRSLSENINVKISQVEGLEESIEGVTITSKNIARVLHKNWVLGATVGVQPVANGRLLSFNVKGSTKYYAMRTKETSRFAIAESSIDYSGGIEIETIPSDEWLINNPSYPLFEYFEFTTKEDTQTIFVYLSNNAEDDLGFYLGETKQTAPGLVTLHEKSIEDSIAEKSIIIPEAIEVDEVRRGWIISGGSALVPYTSGGSQGVVYIYEIPLGEILYIYKHDISDRFRVALKHTTERGAVDEMITVDDDYKFPQSLRINTTEFSPKYLVIQVSNSDETPLVTIHKSPISLNPMYKASHLVPTITGTYIADEELAPFPETLYTPLSLNLVYDEYDSLVVAFPNYVFKELLGEDGDGNPIYSYSFRAPRGSYGRGEVPKIIMDSGMHGNEQLTVWSSILFFKDLCYNPKNKEVLDYIKKYVDIEFIPVINPSGLIANSRTNSNGVNLNRNFATNWYFEEGGVNGSEPFSEPESIILRNFMHKHRDAYIYINQHNTNPDSDPMLISNLEPLIYAINDDTFRTISKNLFDSLGVIKESESHTLFGSMSTYGINEPMSRAYAESIGIMSVISEGPQKMIFDDVRYGIKTLRANVELVSNVIVSALKFFGKTG